MLDRKIILTGGFGVGKTSLFQRLKDNTFDSRYMTTTKVKMDKITIPLEQESINLLIWDIAGEVSQDKVPKHIFLGTSTIVYVFDVTRPSTYEHLHLEVDFLKCILPDALIFFVANKVDLLKTEERELLRKSIHFTPIVFTSAKTGKGVFELFQFVAKDFVSLV